MFPNGCAQILQQILTDHQTRNRQSDCAGGQRADTTIRSTSATLRYEKGNDASYTYCGGIGAFFIT